MMNNQGSPVARSVQRRDEHYPQIQGILSIEISRITKLDMMSISPFDALSVEVRVRNVAKRTMQVRPSIEGTAEWNEVKHMPVIVAITSSNPTNRISLTLHRQSITNSIVSDQIGYISLHLHSIIRSSPGPRIFQMFDHREIFVGRLSIRLIFHYGLFGFGHSPQMSIASSVSAEQYLMSSLIPRLQPPKTRFESFHYTVKPRIVAHPHYIPFRSRVIFTRKKIATGEIKIHPHLASSLTRLETMANTYTKLPSRVQRLAYIAKQFQGDIGEGELAPQASYTTSRAVLFTSSVCNVPDVIDDFVTKMEPWLNAKHILRSKVKAVTNAAQFLSRANKATNTKESPSSMFKRISVSSSKRKSSQGSIQPVVSESRGWPVLKTILDSILNVFAWFKISALPATTTDFDTKNATKGKTPKQAWAGILPTSTISKHKDAKMAGAKVTNEKVVHTIMRANNLDSNLNSMTIIENVNDAAIEQVEDAGATEARQSLPKTTTNLVAKRSSAIADVNDDAALEAIEVESVSSTTAIDEAK